MRLHEWFVTPDGEFVRPSGPAGDVIDEIHATGAVLVGRRTVEQVDHWGGDHHGVPIFVPSHRPPGPSVASYPLVTYVTDGIASAMAQAKAAARDRNVLVHGAYTAQRALEAGVLDEVQIHPTHRSAYFSAILRHKPALAHRASGDETASPPGRTCSSGDAVPQGPQQAGTTGPARSAGAMVSRMSAMASPPATHWQRSPPGKAIPIMDATSMGRDSAWHGRSRTGS